MCEIKLEDIGGESCEPVGGIADTLYIAPKKDLTTIKQPAETLSGYTAIKDLATIAGPHVAATGKGFTKINGVTETGTIKSTTIGNAGGKIFQNELVIEVAGSSADLLGWLRLVKNLRFILLAEEIGTGNIRQLGSDRSPAQFTGIEHALEAAQEGKNSVTLTVQDKQPWPAPVYTGAIPMKPAE